MTPIYRIHIRNICLQMLHRTKSNKRLFETVIGAVWRLSFELTGITSLLETLTMFVTVYIPITDNNEKHNTSTFVT